MTQAESSSSQNQNGEPGAQPSKEKIKKPRLPKLRKPKFAWIVVCCLVAAGTFVYAIIFSTEEKFYEDNDHGTKKAQSNTSTDIYYRKVVEKTYPVVVNNGLVLLGIILGHVIYCFCNIVEELRQFKRRYDRSFCKLFQQCMTGISWKSAIGVGIVDVIAVGLAKKFSFELGDLLYILGGIGVCPLISYLLNQNRQTGVDHSRHLEENMLHPAHTLAWGYYIHRLQKMLPVFIKRFCNSNTPVQDDQGSSEHSDRDTHPKKQLTSKKLILLVSQHYNKDVKLVDLDNRIKEITRIFEGGYEFPLYSLKHNGKEYQYVIQTVDEPLETLQSMCNSEGCKSVHEDQLEEQVKLLCKTLSEKLVKDGYHKNICTFVLITEVDSLQNGGLVKIIMSQIGEEKCESNTEKTPIQKRAQQTDEKPDVPCKSAIVNIDETEGCDNEEKSHTDGFFIPDDRDDDTSAFFGEDKGKTLKRDKNILNPKLPIPIKNKAKRLIQSKQYERVPLVPYPDKNANIETKNTQSTSSKEQEKEDGGETTSPPHRKGDEQPQPSPKNVVPLTSLDTSTLPLQPKNEERSDQLVEQDVECLNETEDDEICGAKSDLINGEGSQATFGTCPVDDKEMCPKEI
jgi:hypothetical protein